MDRSKRVAIYARAESDDREAGRALQDQLGRLRACAETLGVRVHAEYVDTGPAGGVRPRLQEMLRESANPARPFEVVLVLGDSEVFGPAAGFSELAGRLRENSVEIWTVT